MATVKRLTRGIGADYIVECAGTKDAIDEAGRMVNRGGKICLAAFPHEPIEVDVANLVRNNVYVYGIRARERARRTAPWPSWPRSVSTLA